MKKVTGTVTAWLSKHSMVTPKELAAAKPEIVGNLVYFNGDRDWSGEGYTRVGAAEITVELIEGDELIANKVAALRAEKTAIRAEATAKETEIEGQIQNLLAITYQPGEVAL